MSILFKGRDTGNEGEIFYVNHQNEKVTSIFMEANDAKVQAAIDKALKYKIKLKESSTEYITVSPYKDWLGNRSYLKIDNVLAQKYNIKWFFKVRELDMIQPNEGIFKKLIKNAIEHNFNYFRIVK